MNRDKYQEQLQQWRKAYINDYKDYVKLHRFVWYKIENILILPIVGIIAYYFHGIPYDRDWWKFLIVLIVAAAPLIASFLAYFLVARYTAEILEHMDKQLKIDKPLDQPAIIETFSYKLQVINKWSKFTLMSALITISMSILLKYEKVDMLIYLSFIFFAVYILLLFYFVFHIKQLNKEWFKKLLVFKIKRY